MVCVVCVCVCIDMCAMLHFLQVEPQKRKMVQFSDSSGEEEGGRMKERGRVSTRKRETVTPNTPPEPQGNTAKLRYKYRGESRPQQTPSGLTQAHTTPTQLNLLKNSRGIKAWVRQFNI